MPGCPLLRPNSGDYARQEQHRHDGEYRLALALTADHTAKHVGECGADREDKQKLDQIDRRIGVFEGVRGLCVEKSAPLAPSILIASWDATWPCAMSCWAPSSVATEV
jgi:hypothetical protein